LIDSSGVPISTKATYQRFDGLITEIGEELTVDGRVVVINGLNRLEKLMNVVFPGIFKSKYASTMVQELVGHCNDAQRQLPSGARANQIGFGTITATTNKEIDYARNYRTVFELIEELSRQKINGKFNAFYYLDSDNNFHWIQKSDDDDGLVIEEGVDFTRAKWKHKVWDVINAIIADCGNDVYGRAIHAMNYDEASAAEYGLKWAPGIEVETEIAAIIKGKVERYVFDTYTIKKDIDNFPENYGGGTIELGIYERGADGARTSTMATATSDTEYNSAIRDETKWEGIDWIKSVLDLTGKVRPRCDIAMRGAHWEMGAGGTGTSAENVIDSTDLPLNQGDFVKLIAKSTAVPYTENNWFKGLRLTAVSHTFDRNGWVADLHLETDVEDFAPSRYEGETYEV